MSPSTTLPMPQAPRWSPLLSTIVVVLAALVLAGFVVYQHGNTHEQHVIQWSFERSLQGQEPVMQDAIEQVGACEYQADMIYHQDWSRGSQAWDWAQRVVWWPCVQQGEARLREHHAEALIPALHQRMEPVAEHLRHRYDGTVHLLGAAP